MDFRLGNRLLLFIGLASGCDMEVQASGHAQLCGWCSLKDVEDDMTGFGFASTNTAEK